MSSQNAACHTLRNPQVRWLDSGDKSDLLRVILRSDVAGVVEKPALRNPMIAIHYGRPVRLACRHGNQRYNGLAIHGDVEVVPPGVPARWEMKETDTALLVSLSPKLLQKVAADYGFPPDRVEIRDRFYVRDPQIEHIGWALKEEVERNFSSGKLYLDSLATALAVVLLRHHSSVGATPDVSGGLSAPRLRLVLCYIEDNLSEKLALPDIAAVAEFSVTHLKVLFRRSMGVPVHQYVIRRRVERAATLLRQGNLPGSQIALECGFSHQSHMAYHMQRMLGCTPSEFARQAAAARLHPVPEFSPDSRDLDPAFSQRV